jgi:hypothetical protein
MKRPNLNNCKHSGKHSGLPLSTLSIVCVHLLNADSMEWMPVDWGDSMDWLCPECIKDFPSKIKLEEVSLHCIKCVDERRWLFDSNFSQ